MRIFIALVIGVLLGAGALWYYQSRPQKSTAEKFVDRMKEDALSARSAVTDQWRKLRSEDITNELARTGQVIREKARAAGQSLADSTLDARITATIKAKLAADSGLDSLKISVNTTAGVVTLSGAASSAEQVRSAMSIAMGVDGVTKVVSTLQIKVN